MTFRSIAPAHTINDFTRLTRSQDEHGHMDREAKSTWIDHYQMLLNSKTSQVRLQRVDKQSRGSLPPCFLLEPLCSSAEASDLPSMFPSLLAVSNRRAFVEPQAIRFPYNVCTIRSSQVEAIGSPRAAPTTRIRFDGLYNIGATFLCYIVRVR